MSNEINLMAIYIANGMGLMLLVQLLFGSGWKYIRNKEEHRYLKWMLWICVAACIADPMVFGYDGDPGKWAHAVVYFGNLYLFIGTLLIGPGWLGVICNHLYGRISKAQRILTVLLCSVGMVFLIINFFTPIVFGVGEDNVYFRGSMFWIYTLIEGIFLLDGMFVYVHTRIKGGIFKFFPVIQFVLPVVFGVVAQSFVYGISVIWPSVVISMTGLLNSMRNEALYRDPLTGLLNRMYLSYVDEIAESRKTEFTVMMIDLNDFKNINDKFGHSEGDLVLKKAAEVFITSVGALGTVIRYAGDEFVVMLNTCKTDVIERCIRDIHGNLDRENRSSDKDYSVSVSIGYCVFSEEYSTLEKMLNHADDQMYYEKQEYYKKHDRRGKRG
ncbi:MAG: GGDEF domain-containing protein [Clostridia bacterium]|nr:GGDEF domain-containing protein [Clostridia bacterium]